MTPVRNSFCAASMDSLFASLSCMATSFAESGGDRLQAGLRRLDREWQDFGELALGGRPVEIRCARIDEERLEAIGQHALGPHQRLGGILVGEPDAVARLAVLEARVVVRPLECLARAEAEQVGAPDRGPEQDGRDGEFRTLAAVLMETLKLESRTGFVTVVSMLGPSAHSESHAIHKEGVGDVGDFAHLTNTTHLSHSARFSNSRHIFVESRSL